MLPLEFKTFPYLTQINLISFLNLDFSITSVSDTALHIPYKFTGLHALSVLTKHTVSIFGKLFLLYSISTKTI